MTFQLEYGSFGGGASNKISFFPEKKHYFIHSGYRFSHNAYHVATVTRNLHMENPRYQEMKKFYTYDVANRAML